MYTFTINSGSHSSISIGYACQFGLAVCLNLFSLNIQENLSFTFESLEKQKGSIDGWCLDDGD